MMLMSFYKLSAVFCLLQAQLMLLLKCGRGPPPPALLIILSTYCTCSALLRISGCHVCVLTGFHPYGTTRTWTKLNTTGCQGERRVGQQGEHVKRPDGFLFGDSDWLRQLVLVGRSEQMWNEIILHNGSGGRSGWKSRRQARDMKGQRSEMKCLLRKSDKAPLSETFTVGCWSEVVASRSLVKNMLTCYECEAGPCCCIRISNAQREKENSRGFKCENRNESLWQDDNLSECMMVPTLRSTTPCNNNA